MADVQLATCLYAVLSLTVVRMLPVALALIGTRFSAATVLFMGWFGPRGLASIVLGLVYLEHQTQQAGAATIRYAVMLTVLMSIFAHGLSALPGMKLYAQKLKTFPENGSCTTSFSLSRDKLKFVVHSTPEACVPL